MVMVEGGERAVWSDGWWKSNNGPIKQTYLNYKKTDNKPKQKQNKNETRGGARMCYCKSF